MIIGLILVAGKSSRIGTNKAFLKTGDKTFLEKTICNLSDSGVANIVVVTGFEKERIEEEVRRINEKYKLRAQTVYNKHYELGQFSSIKCGVKYIAERYIDFTGIALSMIDHPNVKNETIIKLIKEFNIARNDGVIPCFNDKCGHPIIVSQKIAKKIMNADNNCRLDEIIFSSENKIKKVIVDDNAILENINNKKQWANG